MERGEGWVSMSDLVTNSRLLVLPNRASAQRAEGECWIKAVVASALRPVTPARNADRTRALCTMPEVVKNERRGSAWGSHDTESPAVRSIERGQGRDIGPISAKNQEGKESTKWKENESGSH